MMPNIPAPFKTSTSNLSVITGCLGYHTFHDVTRMPSFFYPAFNLLSLMISAIDRIMVHTYRFHQSSPDWHPAHTQLYYSILFIVHILRVKQSARTITSAESDFLVWFSETFVLASLPIAGPLKHFFQSITVAAGPTKFYGDISPLIGNINLTAAASYTFNDFRDVIFPPIPLIMDYILDMLAARQATFDSQGWQRFYRPLTHVHSMAPVNSDFFFGLPTLTDYVTLPASAMPTYHANANSIGFPPRLNSGAAAAPTLTTIGEYCRLGTAGTQYSLWFPYLVGQMQRHAQFMKDSTNIASISTVGLGATMPIITLSANAHISLQNAVAGGTLVPFAAVAAVAAAPGPPIVLATPGYAAGTSSTRFNHFQVTASVARTDMHLLAGQFALLSCVNLSFTGLAARGNHFRAFPTDAQMRQGPYWNRPVEMTHAEVDVYNQMVTFIVGTFHVDQRLTK
jgi:hypothetical protein